MSVTITVLPPVEGIWGNGQPYKVRNVSDYADFRVEKSDIDQVASRLKR